MYNYIHFKITIFMILRPIQFLVIFIILVFTFRYLLFSIVYADEVKIRRAATASIYGSSLPADETKSVGKNIPEFVTKSSIDLTLAPRPGIKAIASSIGATFPDYELQQYRLKREIAQSMAYALHTHNSIHSTPMLPELAPELNPSPEPSPNPLDLQYLFKGFINLWDTIPPESYFKESFNYLRNEIPDSFVVDDKGSISKNQFMMELRSSIIHKDFETEDYLNQINAIIEIYNASLILDNLDTYDKQKALFKVIMKQFYKQ